MPCKQLHSVTQMGNTSDKEQALTFKLGSKYLNVSLPSHSFNSFVEK